MVGKYVVDVASFESLALPSLAPTAGSTRLVVVDEVGEWQQLWSRKAAAPACAPVMAGSRSQSSPTAGSQEKSKAADALPIPCVLPATTAIITAAGKMELFSAAFYPAVLSVLDAPGLVVLGSVPVARYGRTIPQVCGRGSHLGSHLGSLVRSVISDGASSVLFTGFQDCRCTSRRAGSQPVPRPPALAQCCCPPCPELPRSGQVAVSCFQPPQAGLNQVMHLHARQ